MLMDKLKSEIQRELFKLSQPQTEGNVECEDKGLQDEMQEQKPIQQLVPKLETKEVQEDAYMADEAGEVKEAAPVDVTVSEEIKDDQSQ